MHPLINPFPTAGHITALEMHGHHRRGHCYCMKNKKNKPWNQINQSINQCVRRYIGSSAACFQHYDCARFCPSGWTNVDDVKPLKTQINKNKTKTSRLIGTVSHLDKHKDKTNQTWRKTPPWNTLMGDKQTAEACWVSCRLIGRHVRLLPENFKELRWGRTSGASGVVRGRQTNITHFWLGDSF